MQIVYSIEQLQQLRRRWSKPARKRAASEYILDIPELTGAENDRISARINRYRHTCGCITAGVGVAVAAIFPALSYFAGGHAWSTLSPLIGLLYLGLVLSAGLLGRQLGIIWSALRLRQVVTATLREATAIRELQRQYSHTGR